MRNQCKISYLWIKFLTRFSVLTYHVHLIHYINDLMKTHVELTRTIFTNFTPMLHFHTPWKCQKIKVFWRFQGIQKWNIGLKWVNPFRRKPTQWSNTLKQFVGNFSTNCLSVLDHFEGLALKQLKEWIFEWIEFHEIR